MRDELAERLAAIPGPDGEPLGTRVFRPEDVYDEINGVAPDLIVYFGDLAWRSVGTVGGDEGIHTFENDTGPDDANHAQDGLLIMAGPGHRAGAGATGCTCSTSRRRCSSCSGSRRRRRCAGARCSAAVRRAVLPARRRARRGDAIVRLCCVSNPGVA